jgi:histidinol-phosphate aminotransferase
VASVEVAQAIERVRPPFNVNRLAMEAAVAALGDHEHIRLSIEANAAGLQQVNDGLRAMGLEPVPSRANFVLVETPHEGRVLFEALLRRGVIVRPMGGYGMPRHLRISIGAPGENAVMLEELAAVLAQGPPTT